MAADGPRPLTGRKVLMIAVGAFGVILAANLTLMFTAINTFSGRVVQNSYIASQDFDTLRKAQEALGWTLAIEHDGTELRLDFTDASGGIVRPEKLQVTIGRPNSRHDDSTALLRAFEDGYVADLPLGTGNWNLDVSATAADGTAFIQRRSIYISPNA
jgi:nitrogen fixation protein FixH